MSSCRSVLLALFLFGTVSCQQRFRDADAISKEEKEVVLKQLSKKLKKSGYAFNQTFQDIEDRIARHKSYIDTTTHIGSFVKTMKAVLNEYNLSHLWINTPDEMFVRKQGLGVNLGANVTKTNKGYFVTRIVQGGVADQAGMRTGDILLLKNGHPIPSSRQLRGKISEKSVISLIRGGIQKEVKVRYFKHPLFSMDTLYFLNQSTAVIKVHTFRKGVYDRDYIASLFAKAQHAERIVLDLRSNGGGLDTNVRHLLSMILPSDRVCQYFVYRKDHNAFVNKFGRFPYTIKELIAYRGREFTPKYRWNATLYQGEIMVLIDERSGSGADIFPICVQDTKRGLIVGTKSLGMVLHGDRMGLEKGMTLMYPNGESVRLNGIKLEGNGCVPDIKLSREKTANDRFIHELVSSYPFKNRE
ncbi:S41 family peptidase [Spongiimicrobium salis]|uniref:S41 family peptidase n=1 Tax=Spongiimicrobium salis TaxID=1667022 RepID=UPI00374CB393